MSSYGLKSGKIIVEIIVKDVTKFLNILWCKNIYVEKVKKRNITTLMLVINYEDYGKVCEIVKDLDGQISIVQGKGPIFILGRIKRKYSIVIAIILFFAIIYYLSTYIWSIDISVGKNITPFEVRQQLKELGIYPGIKKSNIDEKSLERKLENLNSEILWLRVRVEGSSLKVTINEKINPPKTSEGQYGNLTAIMDGEIKRVYTFSGRSVVESNEVVKEGDILIEGIDGAEGGEYVIQPRGIVIANTFYEKEMEVRISGNDYKQSGRTDIDIYIEIFGKKIYLKKAIKDFKKYDKIEKSGKVFNKVIYYERVETPVNLTEEQGVEVALSTLEKSLSQNLKRDAKVVDKIVKKEKSGEDFLNVKVVFVVEQNIVSDQVTGY